MGACSAMYREVRFVIEDNLTHCYVLLDAIGDCPIGVQGWHHKVFSADVSALEILERIKAGQGGDGDPILWAQEAPK